MNTYPTPGRPPVKKFDYSQLKYLEGAIEVRKNKITADEKRRMERSKLRSSAPMSALHK